MEKSIILDQALQSEVEGMSLRESDELIVLGAWESQVQGEAAHRQETLDSTHDPYLKRGKNLYTKKGERSIMTTNVPKIANKARENRKLVFTSLAHHITTQGLWECLTSIPKGSGVGIDQQDVASAKESFATWSQEVLDSLHRRGYRPPPMRRVYIPKPGSEKKRPISIPTLQDRSLQKATSQVLNSIYEQDFLPCSYGGRPKRSAHHALADLQTAIGSKKVSWVFEADLKDFFGSLNHEWVERFLRQRVGDPRIITLVRRWLKAGVMEEGQHLVPTQGTAQGGPISVLISNIYLHYVLDLWIEKVVRPKLKGEMYYIRYLDDFVLCFQYRSDAVRFQEVLPKRLEKFSLALEPTKTKLIEFGRFAKRDACRKGFKVATFTFLGITLFCDRNQRGRFKVGMKTDKSRLRRSKAKMKTVLLRIRHRPIREQSKRLNVMLRGHYQYYGVAGNIRCLDHFLNFTVRSWRKALSTRSQNGKVTWEKFNRILKIFPLPQPKLSLTYKEMERIATLRNLV